MINPNEQPVQSLESQMATGELTQLFNVLGLFETVTAFPTSKPTTPYGQIKLYVDSLTSPTVYGMCIYFGRLNVWKFVSMTIGPSLSPSVSPSKSPSKSPSVSPS